MPDMQEMTEAHIGEINITAELVEKKIEKLNGNKIMWPR